MEAEALEFAPVGKVLRSFSWMSEFVRDEKRLNALTGKRDTVQAMCDGQPLKNKRQIVIRLAILFEFFQRRFIWLSEPMPLLDCLTGESLNPLG